MTGDIWCVYICKAWSEGGCGVGILRNKNNFCQIALVNPKYWVLP